MDEINGSAYETTSVFSSPDSESLFTPSLMAWAGRWHAEPFSAESRAGFPLASNALLSLSNGEMGLVLSLQCSKLAHIKWPYKDVYVCWWWSSLYAMNSRKLPLKCDGNKLTLYRTILQKGIGISSLNLPFSARENNSTSINIKGKIY